MNRKHLSRDDGISFEYSPESVCSICRNVVEATSIAIWLYSFVVKWFAVVRKGLKSIEPYRLPEVPSSTPRRLFEEKKSKTLSNFLSVDLRLNRPPF